MRDIAMSEFTLSTDGPTLFVRSWQQSLSRRAVLAICHGMNAHSGHYLWAGQRLAEDGIAVYALDLRGRGQSQGERSYVERIDEYVDDLAAVIAEARRRNPGLPAFLLGHSAGGVVSCHYVLKHQAELADFICESFAFQVPAPAIALWSVNLLSAVAPRAPALRLKNENSSRDNDVVARLNADALILNKVQPSRTVAALTHASDKLKHSLRDITLPVLILHGTHDRATMPAGSRRFLDLARSADKTGGSC